MSHVLTVGRSGHREQVKYAFYLIVVFSSTFPGVTDWWKIALVFLVTVFLSTALLMIMALMFNETECNQVSRRANKEKDCKSL